MNTTAKKLSTAALSIFVMTAAHAVPIAINNAGFEADAVANDTLPNVTPTGWAFNPVTSDGSAPVNLSFVGDKAALGGSGIAGAKEGEQYWLGYSYSGEDATTISGAILNQDTSLLWADLSVGDTLTLSYWATHRNDVSGSIYTAMWLNHPEVGARESVSHGPGWFDTETIAAGVWTQFTWNYVVDQAALDAASAGAWGAVNVGIGFLDPSPTPSGDPGTQVAFDDVSLDYTAVPEPGSLALLGLGGLLIARRRRG